MIPLLFMAASWLTKTNDITLEGNVKFYDPGIMPRVAVNRGYIDDISDYKDWLTTENIDGGAALLRYGDLGRRFSIVWPDGTITRHIAIDCAQKEHYDMRVDIGDIAEVDRAIAQKMSMRGPVGATIVFDDELIKRLRGKLHFHEEMWQ